MATTQNLYTGNGATVLYSFTFPYIDVAHIKVTLDGVATTAYTLANATTVQFNAAPANGVVIRIYRDTAIEAPEAVFYKGSAIRASDLNDNFTQELYKAQEDVQYMVTTDGENPFIGPPDLGGFKITNVGTPTAGTDAATKAYADLKVAKAGDSMTGPLAMGGNKVTGVGTPTAGTDAATKGYVDDLLPGHQAQADAAAASEAAAAASASAAATSYDSFDDRYLGAKATDPSVDNDGGALIVGAIYFNTTLGQMRVFNGTTWQEASADATITRFRFTAVGGETSLSGADDNAEVLTYNVGLELVYLNGAFLTRGVDYTATNGSSITGLVALTTGDVAEIIVLSQINVVGSIPGANIADGTITSAKITDGTIVNADVNASAGIVASKLSFTQAGTGAVARTVDSKLKDVVSVKDFGAVGDGVADDTAAIQAAANSSVHGTLFFPRGIYLVSGQIAVASKSIRGESATNTTVKASASIASVFSVTGKAVVENLFVDGNYLAEVCVLMAGTNGSIIRDCIIEKAKLDGIQYSTTNNNSNSVVESSLVRIHGTEYSTGTAAGTSGGSTVTITGAADLTTLGIRLNETYIYMAGDSGGFAYEVTAVTATTVTVFPALASTFSGSTYKILQGSCVNVRRNGDNSRITLRNCTFQAGKVAGVQDLSLYSVVSIACLYEGNSYGRICGARSVGWPTYGPLEIGNYYEINVYNDLLYAYALGENVRISSSGSAVSQRVFSGSTGPTVISKTPESTIPAHGIAFPATQIVSSDANTLDDYEEGTWTPIDGSAAALTFTSASGLYVKIGKLVYASCALTYPSTATANGVYIGGLPFAQANTNKEGGYVTNNTSATPLLIRGYSGATVQPVTLAGAAVANSSLSAASLRFTFIYSVTS